MFNLQILLMLSLQSKVSITCVWEYIEGSEQAGIFSHNSMMCTKPKNAVNQPLAKQPPLWGLCWCAKWKGTFHLLSWEARQKVRHNFWPMLSCISSKKRNPATHNRWTHFSLVRQIYMLLLVSSTVWIRWSFYNCLLKCNHFIRAEMQVLKYCFWWGMNAGTSVTVPLCSHVTAHVHGKNGTETKHSKALQNIGHLRSLSKPNYICKGQAPQFHKAQQQHETKLNSSVPSLIALYQTAFRPVKNMK